MSYEWNYTVCNFSRLVSFTQHNTFAIPLNCCMYLLFLPSYCWVISFVWKYHKLFIHSPGVKDFWIVFQFELFWATMNRTAINTDNQVLYNKSFHSPGRNPRRGISGFIRNKKDLHDPDNHDGVITNLESDILECEVKWALESITTNKANGGDGIPVELFQILEDDALKVLHSICQQIWKTRQWPQHWKSQFSFQSQRKAMPKNAQTTTQLHSSHTLAK